MKKGVYFGSSLQLAKELSRYLDLTIVAEVSRKEPHLEKFCSESGISLYYAKHRQDIPLLNADIGISFGFGLIFSKEFLSKNSFPIINVHPGSLHFNRGRHPLHWNIYLNESDVHIVFHLVTVGIDEGPIILQITFLRDPEWTLVQLEAKVTELIIHNVGSIIHNYRHNDSSYPVVTNGLYRTKFSPRHVSDPAQISSIEIIALMKIQLKYGGLTINGRTYIDVKDKNTDDLDGAWHRFTCNDGVIIALKEKAT